MKISLKKKQKKPLDEKTIKAIMHEQLSIQQEKYEQFFRNIEKDKEKKRIWNSLSNQKKIRLLKHVAERGKNEK